MNISLRRANSIQHQIQEVIASIKIVGTIELGEFHDVETELHRANVELFTNDARRQRLLLALYTIRGLVGAANAGSGIDVNLAKAAFLEKRIAQLNDIIRLEAATRLEIIRGRIEKIKNSGDQQDVYGRAVNTVSTTVVSEDQLKQTRAEVMNLKRQRQRLMDEVLELNVKTDIPLNEDIVKTLTDEGIV
jgi:hypothetical protein